jgi:hypothetical protein
MLKNAAAVLMALAAIPMGIAHADLPEAVVGSSTSGRSCRDPGAPA